MGLQGIIWSENRLNHRVPQSSMYWNMMSFYNLCKHSWQSQRTGYAGHPGTVIASLPSTTKSPGHWLSWEEVGNCLGEKLRKCKWNCQEKKKRTGQGFGQESPTSCRPTESGQNEKQAHNYTSCQEAKWKSHKGGHSEACDHLGKLLTRISE